VCTSRTIDDVAATHGAPVIKTRVGQVYVSATLADEQGLLGGEGSGSVMLPAFSKAYDGFLMMALILDAMAKSGEPVSALLQDLPRYAIVKRSISCSSRMGYRGLEAIKSDADFLKYGEVNTLDGLRVDWESGWVHVRQSQTQQMLRVIAEARRREVAQEMADQAARIIQEAL
jgi:phosphomannomutase